MSCNLCVRHTPGSFDIVIHQRVIFNRNLEKNVEEQVETERKTDKKISFTDKPERKARTFNTTAGNAQMKRLLDARNTV